MTVRRVIALVVVLLLAAVLVRALWGESLEPSRALAAVRSVQDAWWAWPLFFVAYFTLTWVFVPVTLFHMVAGAALGFGWGLVANLLAFNLSSSLQFFFARRVLRGDKRASATAGAAGTAEETVTGASRRTLQKVERMLERDGLRAAVLVRVLPIPNMAVNLAAGLSTIRWRDFALGTLLGASPVVVVYTWFASALVEGLAHARRDALLSSAVAAVAIALLAVGSRLLRTRAKDAA